MRESTSRLPAAVLCLLFLISSAVSAFDFSEIESKIQERTLDNGLKIIVMERHDAPVASFLTWANVGAVDDPKGYTGMAHMFEHMAFKGTTSLGSKDIDRELELIALEDSLFMELRAERNKGRLADSSRVADLTVAFEEAREAAFELVEQNAFSSLVDREGGNFLNAGTSNDFTVYFFNLPSNKAELWMALESERFLNPVLREMYKEKEVVAEERRMGIESSPFGRLMEEFQGLSFRAHPYGNEVLGHMSDIQNFTREAAREYFEEYYGPSNLTVVVVGDVKPKRIFELADTYWSRIPARPAPQRIATVEPEQLGERRMVIEDPSQPLYAMGWHIPEGTHPDRPAIDAALDYFAEGRTSLLYESLVKDKKAAVQVGSIYGFPGEKYPTMVLNYVIPSQGHTNLECEELVFTEVEKLKDELLPVEEVDKIKARAKAEFIAGGFGPIGGLASNLGMAIKLGMYEQYWGDWRELFSELDRINAVTPEDIQRVTKTYFTEKNRVVVMMNTTES